MLFAPCGDTRVIAIDPNPDCIAWIRGCLASYPGWRVDTVNCGLSDQAGTLTLFIPSFDHEEGGQATVRSDWYVNRDKRSIEIDVKTMDDLLESLGVSNVRLWKIDVEGWERNVLQGARRLFSERRIDAVYAEVHPSNVEFFQQYMKSHGFDFFAIGSGARLTPLGETLPPAQDYLAIRQDLAPK